MQKLPAITLLPCSFVRLAHGITWFLVLYSCWSASANGPQSLPKKCSTSAIDRIHLLVLTFTLAKIASISCGFAFQTAKCHPATKEKLAEGKSMKENNSNCEDELDEILRGNIRCEEWKRKPGTHLQIYTVVEYAENQNLFLSLSLQQQLDAMTPREFLTYIFQQLSLEERESLMLDEGQRRKTFQTGWTLTDQLNGEKMAAAGFYYLDDSDRVQCVFCRGRLHNWERDDNPMVEHARSFTFCRFIKGLPCNNREYRSNKLSQEDMVNITAYGNRSGRRQTRDGLVDSALLGICTNRAAVIRFAPHSARLRTFNRWPTGNAQSAENLCDAGFYYTGFGDKVKCFFCSGGIGDWSERDDPWEEHARWFPDCSYLVNKKGKDYIDRVHASTPDNKKCVRQTTQQKNTEAKQRVVRTTQEEMAIVCGKLGHSKTSIDEAITANGGPFKDIKDMVDALHELENKTSEELSTSSANASTSSASPNDVEMNEQPPTSIDQSATNNQNSDQSAICKLCKEVKAEHVGLPCGHLIHCGPCNAVQVEKSLTDQMNCPTCRAPLSGSIKIYFA